MAERPIWRGMLRLALVSCPVALHSVRRPAESLHFHYINPETGHRVRMVTHDSETDEELQRRDLQRGFEYEKDRYLLLEEADFEQARIESSGTLSIDKFVEGGSIDPLFYDSSYYMAPDDQARGRQDDVFSVLREAIRDTGRVALSRLVLSRRERAVAVLPMGRGLVLHTLHDMREIADPASLWEQIPADKPDPAMLGLARQLIDRQTAKFEPSDMEDRYEARLRKVIDAKLQGIAPEPLRAEAEADNVIDLMAALRRSLGEDKPAAKPKAKTQRKAASPKKAASSKKPTRRRSA